uniref:SLC26A/SulP transporter domain-containing protein n=1 Tax=Plectus sambesii TaxID=2011161 RepID=A0A914V4K1_9BILA
MHGDGNSILRRRRRNAWTTKTLSKTLSEFVPITRWLPNYKSGDLLSDTIGGLTLGVMVVPQGMAYISMAGLAPAYGLYSSFFPCLLYMILGTSHHVSLGVFGVISLM